MYLYYSLRTLALNHLYLLDLNTEEQHVSLFRVDFHLCHDSIRQFYSEVTNFVKAFKGSHIDLCSVIPSGLMLTTQLLTWLDDDILLITVPTLCRYKTKRLVFSAVNSLVHYKSSKYMTHLQFYSDVCK